jgi:hypothetical protein
MGRDSTIGGRGGPRPPTPRERLQQARNNRQIREERAFVERQRQQQNAWAIQHWGERSVGALPSWAPIAPPETPWNSYRQGEWTARDTRSNPYVPAPAEVIRWPAATTPATSATSPDLQPVNLDAYQDYLQGEREARHTHVWFVYDQDYEHQVTLIGETLDDSLRTFLDHVLAGNWDPTQESDLTTLVRGIFERAGISLSALSRFTTSYDPNDPDYKATEATVNWISSNFLVTSGSNTLADTSSGVGSRIASVLPDMPELATPIQSAVDAPALAERYADYLVEEAQLWGIDLGSYANDNLLVTTQG